jgi:hypothetical protein
MLFDFGCGSLVQEMSFVDCSLPYFRQRLISHPLSARLPFLALFTESSWGDQLLALPPSPVHSVHPAPSAACSFSVPCLFFLFFFAGRGSVQGSVLGLSRGLCWFIPGLAVGIPHTAYLLTCWSASSKQMLEPASGGAGAPLFSCFPSETRH